MPGSFQRKKRSRAVTLADVGRTAGVSAMAVSAVLTGGPASARIPTGTRARILAAAEQLRYQPNAVARALVARRMDTIGIAAIVDPSGLNTYFLELLNGVLEGAASYDQYTTMLALHDWESDAPQRLPKFCDGRIDGLILIAPLLSLDVLRRLPDHTPFVTVHGNISAPGIVNLESDEETGAYQLVRHLIQCGHRRILHLTGPPGRLGTERRIRGYRRALLDGGIPLDLTLIMDCEYNPNAGRNTMRAWLRDHPDAPLPDAIFGANDGIAVGVLEALTDAGYSVPRDVSVAGFDDTLSARTTSPALTTVRQPLREMGQQAVEALLKQIRGDPKGSAPVQTPLVFPTEVVIRASVADHTRNGRRV